MPGRMAQWGNDLYTGKRSYDVIGAMYRWFAVAGVVVLAAVVLLSTVGLNAGIAFRGGSEFTVPGVADVSEQPALDAVAQIEGADAPRVSIVGSDSIRVQTSQLSDEQTTELSGLLADAYDVDQAQVGSSFIGATWGQDVTNKAMRGLVIFLFLVAGVLTVYFRDWRMALSGIVALLHDVAVTVGVYAAIGWEVTPATLIGFLTILGYSLYDTVVVFDKVRENVAKVTEQRRYTFGEMANLAVNQTLVRSLNTSVVAVLPVASILFIGAFLLGAGTLRDIALALFVGIIVGTYSSIFLAPPMLVWLREREPRIREHNALVAKTRAAAAVAGPGEEPARIRVGALVPGEHQGNRAQPRRKSPNRPAGRKS